MKKKNLRVVELFAGVGGFRLGLEGWKGKSASSGYKKRFSSNYEVVWSNQWEPSTKRQHANEVYIERFKKGIHSGEDIASIDTKDIPDHDLLVGGFPCQDYSVASTLKTSGGLYGKKGVLWWQIERILREKGDERPDYLFLENVDRLLKSPADQRGRDFAVMLASLSDLGYLVEWKVINAADYGMPQRRRRIYILGYHKDSLIGRSLSDLEMKTWLEEKSLMAEAFQGGLVGNSEEILIKGELKDISSNFNKGAKRTKPSPFKKYGVMMDRKVLTSDIEPDFTGIGTLLGDVLLPLKEVPDEFFINEDELPKWEYHKGAKKIPKTTSEGYTYNFSEGPMVFPDPLDRPSRTIITGEGGKTPSRFKHVVKQGGKYRRLTPIELERLNQFPDDHTKLEGIPDAKRAFFMGNALVIGVIERIGMVMSDRLG
ncbi:MAG: DNA (cytosine-5-)-methyltransferase [Bacteroidota bacterium]|nr:DNA (cytosine-5-)-methyltransferase [Bacteroidota bacterium]